MRQKGNAGINALAAVYRIPHNWIADTGSASDLVGKDDDVDSRLLKTAY
jgi:hypothetical protein